MQLQVCAQSFKMDKIYYAAAEILEEIFNKKKNVRNAIYGSKCKVSSFIHLKFFSRRFVPFNNLSFIRIFSGDFLFFSYYNYFIFEDLF